MYAATSSSPLFVFFFFNDPATPKIYPLPLPAPLPISTTADLARALSPELTLTAAGMLALLVTAWRHTRDRKSTRLNSSHSQISYAVFCLKKKKTGLSNRQR